MCNPQTMPIFAAVLKKKDMALGDYVMISPGLTQYGDWVKGQVIEVEDNSFVGTVISAQTEDGNIFFGRAADFKGFV